MAIKSFASEMSNYQNPHHSHAEENISELQTKVNRLETIVYALWEILKEQDNIGEQALLDKIEEVVLTADQRKRPAYDPVIINCPKCGKAIQESRSEPLVGRCLYCGEKVLFHPYPPKEPTEQRPV